MPTHYEIEQFFLLLPDLFPIIVITVWSRFVTNQPYSLSPSAAAPHSFGCFFSSVAPFLDNLGSTCYYCKIDIRNLHACGHQKGRNCLWLQLLQTLVFRLWCNHHCCLIVETVEALLIIQQVTSSYILTTSSFEFFFILTQFNIKWRLRVPKWCIFTSWGKRFKEDEDQQSELMQRRHRT